MDEKNFEMWKKIEDTTARHIREENEKMYSLKARKLQKVIYAKARKALRLAEKEC